MNELPELSSAAKALLDSARKTTAAPPPSAQADVFAKLSQTLALPPPAPAPAPAPTALGSALGGKIVSVAIASFVLGAGAGAGALALLTESPPPRVEYVEVKVPVTQIIEKRVEVPAPVEQPAPTKKVAVKPQQTPIIDEAPPKLEETVKDDALEQERTLLERARSALSRGKAEDARTALIRHETEFANGQLKEEREVLFIQVLVTQRAFEQARARAEAFRKNHPRSILLPTVDAVLENVP